jgi:hypothetical protein
MKNLLFPALLLASIFMLSSCQKMMYKVFFDVKKPSYQTEAQILEFLSKNKYPTENLYGISAAAHNKRIGKAVSSVAYFTTSNIYNRDGFLVSAKDTAISECWGKTYEFYKNIADNSQLNIDSTTSVYADTLVMNNLVNLSGHKQTMFSTQDYDYTVVVFWASFLGKLSRQNIELGQLVKLYNPALKIQVIQINMDYRTYWEDKNRLK